MSELVQAIDELDHVRSELTRLHKVKRETEWRSVAYRAGVDIIDLKRRRTELRRKIRELT